MIISTFCEPPFPPKTTILNMSMSDLDLLAFCATIAKYDNLQRAPTAETNPPVSSSSSEKKPSSSSSSFEGKPSSSSSSSEKKPSSSSTNITDSCDSSETNSIDVNSLSSSTLVLKCPHCPVNIILPNTYIIKCGNCKNKIIFSHESKIKKLWHNNHQNSLREEMRGYLFDFLNKISKCKKSNILRNKIASERFESYMYYRMSNEKEDYYNERLIRYEILQYLSANNILHYYTINLL